MQTCLMRDIIAQVLPNGYPSDQDVQNMSVEDKELLYEKQKEIIRLFREQSREVITQYQHEIEQEMERQLNLRMVKSSDNLLSPSKSPSPTIKVNKNKIVVHPPVFSSRPKRRVESSGISPSKAQPKHEEYSTRPRFIT